MNGPDTSANALSQLIQKDFLRRLKVNPHYSLRAYSQALGINQSYLSKVLSGKRQLSGPMRERLMLRLGQTPGALEQAEKTSRLAPIADDAYLIIKEWQHFAILELLKTKSFRASPVSIARALGLHTEEAKISLERLERAGFLSRKANTYRLLRPHNTFTDVAKTTEARRFLQKALAEKSVAAIESIPFEERDHGSLTIAVDKKRLPEFKQKLQQIRRELGDFFQQGSGDLNEVYQLTLGFFPVTSLTKNAPEAL